MKHVNVHEAISKPTSGGAKAPPWGEVGALPIWRLAWNKIMFWASVPRPCSPPTGVCLIVGVKPRTSIHAPNSPIPWPYAAGGVHR